MGVCQVSRGGGQAAQARVSSPPGGKLPRSGYLTPHYSLSEEIDNKKQ